MCMFYIPLPIHRFLLKTISLPSQGRSKVACTPPYFTGYVVVLPIYRLIEDRLVVLINQNKKTYYAKLVLTGRIRYLILYEKYEE